MSGEASSGGGWGSAIAIFLLIFMWNMTPSRLTVLPTDCQTGAPLTNTKASLAMRISPLQRAGLAKETNQDGSPETEFLDCTFLDSDNWRCTVPDMPQQSMSVTDGVLYTTGILAPFPCGETLWHRYIGKHWDKIANSFYWG